MLRNRCVDGEKGARTSASFCSRDRKLQQNAMPARSFPRAYSVANRGAPIRGGAAGRTVRPGTPQPPSTSHCASLQLFVRRFEGSIHHCFILMCHLLTYFFSLSVILIYLIYLVIICIIVTIYVFFIYYYYYFFFVVRSAALVETGSTAFPWARPFRFLSVLSLHTCLCFAYK